jgi:hypothetical protein
MFVGAINSTLRKFLASHHGAFSDVPVVVGCSGNFTSEATLSQFANPTAIHSNDVSFYSCLVGGWLCSSPLEFEITEAEFSWLNEYADEEIRRVASIMVLLEMLQYEKRNNAHRQRMWGLYRSCFPDLVGQTVKKLGEVNVRVASFFAGDVMEHFQHFADEPDAVFCCYAPTYSGGYERMYRRLDEIVAWNEPRDASRISWTG